MTTAPLSDLTATWNSAGTTLSAIKMNVTDTASAAASLLLDLQVGGTSRAQITKAGRIAAGAGSAYGSPQFYDHTIGTGTGIELRASDVVMFHSSNALLAASTSQGIRIDSASSVGWTVAHAIANVADLRLWRDAADTLAQRNSTTAQTHRWYRSFTDASNYSRIYLGWSSSTAILATEGAGTGARGNIAFGTAALATSATVGYVMIPSCAGAPTGVPADIPTGQVALHYDTANNKIYVYNGGWVATAALT